MLQNYFKISVRNLLKNKGYFLGASVADILLVFSREFTILVLFAFSIAAPISYYLMNNWLQDFTYKIEIGVGFFLLAITGSLLLVWITIGFKAIKASIENPINVLKSE